MPTVIDELIVSIGLDAAKFRPGVDEAVRASAKMRDETTKHAKEMKKSFGDDLSDAFTKVTTKVVAFLGALAGAQAIEQFTANVTRSGVALGIMAQQLGTTPERLSAIGLAVERVGGSSEGAWGSLKKLNDARLAFQTWGTAPPEWFTRLGINLKTATSGEDVLNQAVKALQAPGSRYKTFQDQLYALEQLGVDPVYARLRLSEGYESAVQAASVDAVTSKQVKAAQDLYAAWERASQAVMALGRGIEEHVVPYLVRSLDIITNIASRKPTDETLEPTKVPWLDRLAELDRDWTGKALESLSHTFSFLVEKAKEWSFLLGNLRSAIDLEAWTVLIQTATERWVTIIGVRVGTAIENWKKVFNDWWASARSLWDRWKEAGGLEGMTGGGAVNHPEGFGPAQSAGTMAGTLLASSPGSHGAVHQDWMAHVARQGGLPILVGGTPVSESSPMPVKIIGSVQVVVPPSRDLPPPEDASKGATHWWSPVTKALGFAKGGSFIVAGREGLDANQVVLNLTKGERVDITTGDQQSAFATKVFNAAKALGLGKSQARLAAAQSSLESGYGQAAPGNNYFGIKASPDWSGATTSQLTGEQTPSGSKYSIHAAFRAYSSLEDSIRDYVKVTKDLWPKVSEGQTFLGAVKGLYHGKYGAYSTDRNYSSALDAVRSQIREKNNSSLLLGGAAVGASTHAQSLRSETSQSNTHVNISGITFSSDAQKSARNDLSKRLSRELFALRSDVGLA